jgi:hypothetical protein
MRAEMTVSRKRQTAAAPDARGEPHQVASRRPTLVLAWVVDPATGKPVARWVVEAAERALAPAA